MNQTILQPSVQHTANNSPAKTAYPMRMPDQRTAVNTNNVQLNPLQPASGPKVRRNSRQVPPPLLKRQKESLSGQQGSALTDTNSSNVERNQPEGETNRDAHQSQALNNPPLQPYREFHPQMDPPDQLPGTAALRESLNQVPRSTLDRQAAHQSSKAGEKRKKVNCIINIFNSIDRP